MKSEDASQDAVFDGTQGITADAYEKDVSKWEEFTIEELGISFKYPPKYIHIDFSITDYSETTETYVGTGEPVRQGKDFYGLVCTAAPPCYDGQFIKFGGITDDFRAPRGRNIDENLGYVERNGVYFQRLLGGNEAEISYPVEEIQSENTSGILVIGNDTEAAPGALPPGDYIAIFNLDHPEFPAVTFYERDVSREEFTAVMNTVEMILQ